MYNYETVQFTDESYLPIDHFVEKTIINQRSKRTLKDYKQNYSHNGSNPYQIFYLGMLKKGKFYERKVRTLSDMLGKLGGLTNSLGAMVAIFVRIMGTTQVYK